METKIKQPVNVGPKPFFKLAFNFYYGKGGVKQLWLKKNESNVFELTNYENAIYFGNRQLMLETWQQIKSTTYFNNMNVYSLPKFVLNAFNINQISKIVVQIMFESGKDKIVTYIEEFTIEMDSYGNAIMINSTTCYNDAKEYGFDFIQDYGNQE